MPENRYRVIAKALRRYRKKKLQLDTAHAIIRIGEHIRRQMFMERVMLGRKRSWAWWMIYMAKKIQKGVGDEG